MVFVTQALFYGLCWIDWGGGKRSLPSGQARVLLVLGMVFWPQDAIYLAVLLVISAYALFLATAIGGPAFLVTPPQTVYGNPDVDRAQGRR